jgi:cohesin complex subunit SA-1/2
LGGAFQAAVERYASDLEIPEGEDGTQQDIVGKLLCAADSREQADNVDLSPEKASAEILFLQLVAVFVGAIRCGVLDSDHAKEPLGHCGRFGATYDAVVKKLVDVLRDEGIYNRDSDTVVAISEGALEAVCHFPKT